MKSKASKAMLGVAAALLALWCFVALIPDNVKQAAAGTIAKVVVGQQPIPVKQTVTVEPGRTQTFAYEFPTTPGRLYGTWNSKRISGKIKGATDDTLVAFRLIGPNNETLQNLDHPTSGNFDIRITSPGRYTFVLDNGGVIRMSERVVSIDAMYHPE